MITNWIARLRANPGDQEALNELLAWAEKVDQHYYKVGETYKVTTPDGQPIRTLAGFAGPCGQICHSRGDSCPGILRFTDGSECCPFYPLSMTRRASRAEPNEYSMALQFLEKMLLKGRKQGFVDLGTFRIDFKIKPLSPTSSASPDTQSKDSKGQPA